MGIPNDSVSCDSLSVQQRVAVLEDGKEVEKDGNEDSDDGDDGDDDEPDDKGNTRKTKITKITLYVPKIVIRVRLENETVQLFGMLMFNLLKMVREFKPYSIFVNILVTLTSTSYRAFPTMKHLYMRRAS